MHAKIRSYLSIALAVAAIVQIVLDSTGVNIACTAAACLASAAILAYTMRPQRFQRFPVSTFGLFFYGFVVLAVPVFVNSFVAFRPIVANLRNPGLVFGYGAAGGVVLMLAHRAYETSRKEQQFRSFLSSLAGRLCLFDEPSDSVLWIMGLAGLLIWIAGISSGQGSGGEAQSPFGSTVAQLRYYAFLPFAIVLRSILTGRAQKVKLSKILAVSTYFIAIVLLSLASGVRQSIVDPIASMTVIVLIWLGCKGDSVPRRTLRNLALGAVALVLAVIPFEQLATAVVVVRGSEGHVSPIELASLTVEALGNKKALENNSFSRRSEGRDYGDYYYDSELLTRIYDPKWSDNAFSMGMRLSEQDRTRVQQFATVQPLLVLPTPVLKIAGIQVDKGYWSSFSVGDYIRYLTTGDELGGRSTSFYTADTVWLGVWFLPALGLFGLIVFPLLDSFALRRGEAWQSSIRSLRGRRLLQLSPLLIAKGYFFGAALFSLQSLAGIAFVFRDTAQIAIGYFILYRLATALMASLPSRVRRLPLDRGRRLAEGL
jgi:hypothetical protein